MVFALFILQFTNQVGQYSGKLYVAFEVSCMIIDYFKKRTAFCRGCFVHKDQTVVLNQTTAMRKFYSFLLSGKVLLLLPFFLISQLKAQVTVSTAVPSGVVYVSDTEPGVIVFGVRNTNSSPITITGIGAYLEAVAGTGTYSLWYHPTAVTGAPSAITAANGWVKLTPSGTVTPTNNSVIPLISGLSLTIPANTTYRLALEGPIHAPYYGTSGSTGDLFSGGGLLIYAQNNAASPTYAGTFPNSPQSFTPRSFYGNITFVPASTCVDPPTPGTPVVPTQVCTGSNMTLDLTGNSIGTGQTYQWQSSPDDVNWTDVGPASSSQIMTTPVTTTGYYRVRVTCGATTVNSPSALVTATTPLSGTYTINSNNGTGGSNFQSFTDAAARLAICGVSGPVVFNVEAGSGPYNEQVTFTQIGGVSATNTVTINGNNAVIQFTPVTASRHIIRLDGADYVTIKDLKILANAGSTFGWGIHLTNGANRNTIDNCTIDISAVTSTTQSNSACIVASGSTTSVITDGSASNNTIKNNTLIGAYQGIIMNGATGSLNSVQNQITGNTIRDFYANGIELTDNDGTIVSNNDISRAGRTGVTTFAGVELGSGNINCVVNGNRIHDTHNTATTQSGTAYGVFSNANDAPAGSENKVINNLIYNFNSTTGTIYGLYNSGSDGVFYYHNTVVLNHSGSTSGITRGFYQTTAASNIDIKNNIIYIARGGTGVKYALYFNTATSVITSNNNILYNVASAGTNGVGSIGTTGYATIDLWQGANGGTYDQQSVYLDPQFVSPGTGDFQPGNSLANNTGVNVGVTTDILGNTRSTTTPDAGAYEISFIVAGNNMSAEALVTPSISTTGCYTSNETVTIRIRNNGSTTLNFATNNVTVTVNVTGATTQTLTTTINTGTLNSDATLDVVLPGVLNMSAAGIYTFNAFTTLAGDTNPADDAMPVADLTKELLNAGVASVSPDVICISQSINPVLSTDGSEFGYGSLQWQQSTTPGTGFTDITGATTSTFNLTGPVTQTIYYRLVASCGTATQNSPEVMLTVTNPQVLTTTAGSRCGPGEVTLSATSAPGTTLNWYDAATGGTAIGTGNTFVTPTLTNTTTFYVAASTGSGGLASAGLPNAISTTGYTLESGLFFDALTDFTLEGVYVYPMGTGAGDVTIALQTTGNVTLQSLVVPMVGTGAPYVKTYVPLNFNVTAGTDYRLVMLTRTGLVSGLLRESGASWGSYPLTLPGVLNITSGKCCPDATSTSYYFFYDWQVSTGCESPRTAVTANVSAAANLNVSQDSIVCNNAITALTIESNPANYDSYIWSPTAGLYTDAAATIPYAGGNATTLYSKISTEGEHKFYINASNSVTTCSNIDSVTITVLPSSLAITATQLSICGGGTTSVFIPAGTPGNIQWYSSNDGISYTLIPGATSATYDSPALTDTTYYKVEIRNGAGVVCLQPTITINVNSPQVLTTTDGTRCSPGTVNLSATGTPGTNLLWYDVPTGGFSLGTGNTFTTPSITNTTTYYVGANTSGGTINTGMPAALSTATSGAGTTNFGLVFDALSPFTLKTVTIYPVSSTAGLAGTVTIDVVDDANNVLHTATVNVIGNPSASATAQVVTLNFDILPGTNLKLRPGARSTGITGLLFEPAASAPGGNYGYPYVVPGVLSINTSTLTAPPTNTARNDLYYYFYDWVIGGGCESPRMPVTAFIAAPELTVQQDTVVCNNVITALSVTSNLTNFDSYVWTPSTGLYTDAAATIPYTGGNATTVYARSNTEGLHKYFINAVNSATTCANIDSVSVTVLPSTLSIEATRTQICQSGSTILSIPDGDYSNALQWYSSSDGVTYTPIAGETSTTYTTPVLTATTYYKVEAKNSAGAVCLQPTITIHIGNPQVVSTTNATRCGPGTLNLGATIQPAGATVNWYSSATGGMPIATGSTFTTPILSSTTTYYASSAFGFSTYKAGRLAPASPTNLAASPRGIQFNATQAVRLQSVTVFSTSADAGTGTIELQSSSGAVLAGPINVSWVGGGSTANPIPNVLNLNIDVPVGTGHRLLLTTRTGGGISYETSGISGTWGNYSSPGGEIELTASMTSLTATSLTAYYFFYDWTISAGCESPRTAVTATVTPAPALSVSTDTLLCNNVIVPLSVESTIADFDSYTWSPVAGLFTDAAATIPYTGGSATTVYARITTEGINKYYINALNSSTNCANIDSVSVTVLPATLALEATRTQICQSGSTTLSLPDGEFGNAGLQWYFSLDGVAYTPIAGATSATYNTPVLTTSTYYRVEIKNEAGVSCLQPTILISVGIPEILATQPATRCDPGSVTLGATPGPATATINWYESATGGLPIATGTTFNTPVLTASTTYYAASAFGFTTSGAGRPAPASPTNLAASPRGIRFNATQAVHLESVTVYSTAADAGSGTIELQNSAGTVLAGPINVSWVGGGSTASPIANVLLLNFNVPVGTDHRLMLTTRTGGGIAYETSGITGTWPNYTSAGGEIEIMSSMTSATGTSTTAYYYFYDWRITTGCESARVPVDAIINGSITIDADPIDKTLCEEGQPVIFSVTASGAISDYQWRKNGVNIPGATSPTYTLASAMAADAGDYDVVITGPCSTDTSEIATLTISAATIVTADPVAQEVCLGSSVTFNATATGAGSLGYQWRKDGVNITGAYASSFTINNVALTDVGNYDVIVTGGCNQDTSAAAALAVGEPIAVVTQPSAQSVCSGDNVTFTTLGSGMGTLNYQWRKGGVNIAGANSATYTITGVAVADAGNYDVVITDNCGSVISNVAQLSVTAGTNISVQPQAQSICNGSSVTFSVVATGTGTLTYQWRKGGIDIPGATSSTYSIVGVTPADVADYDVVITGSCGTVTSSVAGLIISQPGSWTGAQNSDWNNAANWCGTIPTSTTDVLIPATAANMPVLSNVGFARNIVIENGATVTVNTGGTLNLFGNITGAGVFSPNLGTVAFRSATAQTVPAFTATNVTMDGAGGFTLSGNTSVTGTITFTQGHITLGSNNLTIGNAGNGSTASHIITNGSGSVLVPNFAASTTRVVPVGISAASYTPITITSAANHITDDLSVSVREHVLTNGTTGGQIDEFVVDRTWIINESVQGGSNVDVTVHWNEADELPNFGRNESYVMQYLNGAWVTGTESMASGVGPYMQTRTNVTTFSPFAVQTDPLLVVTPTIYPNPVIDILNVVVRTNAPEKMTISVFDMGGKLIKTQYENVGFGGTQLAVNVTGLSAGTYILKISIPRDREFFVRRFVKVN